MLNHLFNRIAISGRIFFALTNGKDIVKFLLSYSVLYLKRRLLF
ncbi:hypothetical protein NSE_0634 [Neorickettsia sennetsu str. Miyayama]|uniref:Uncharacterized protein n=1 Tax=Ehrlichia sennetsu (strain ATCC VR-367 / Miyayama) TaxID=222891 RepID=Q2GDD4_EHRS3|nr:hypothetical protein NSE_0634 [Neorickettsia sennetsu str. Miyayama]